jgi:hypothetical protein
MALLANVSLTNTFDTWRTRTNQLVTRINQFAINESSLYANTLTSNTAFTAKGTATVTGLFTASGRATVGTNLTVSGNTTIGAAGKTANVTGWFGVLGRASVSTNLWVSGNTNFGAVGKVSNTTGWFGVNGRATVGTNLFVGGNTIIGSSGRLGIGTATPSYPLVLSASQNSALVAQIINTNAGGSAQGILQVQVGASAYVNYATSPTYNQIIGTGAITTQYIDFDTQVFRTNAGTEVARFTNGGLKVAANTTLAGTTTDNSNARSQTLTDGATISWDTSLGRVATVTLGAAGRTMAAPTNLKVGTYILRVYQDATGSRTITTWNSVFKWTAAVAPVLSTGAGKLDIITFFSDGTNLYGSYLPDMR